MSITTPSRRPSPKDSATAFITNDAVFERVKSFETLVLDRLL